MPQTTPHDKRDNFIRLLALQPVAVTVEVPVEKDSSGTRGTWRPSLTRVAVRGERAMVEQAERLARKCGVLYINNETRTDGYLAVLRF